MTVQGQRRAKRCLWVVEMLVQHGRISAWQPTIGVKLSQLDGYEELRCWRASNPNDRFHLRRYVAERSSHEQRRADRALAWDLAEQ